jgi:hypothetical protein
VEVEEERERREEEVIEGREETVEVLFRNGVNNFLDDNVSIREDIEEIQRLGSLSLGQKGEFC